MSNGNSMNWGVTEAQLAEIERDYGGRIVVKSDDGGPPGNGRLETWNKRHATVRIGQKVLRYSLSDLRPTIDYKYTKPKEPPKMPPEFAPRPQQVVVPAPVPAPSTSQGVGSNIVVLAARIEQKAQEIRDKRAEFAKIEKDYQDAKAVRDAYAGDVQAMEQEYQAAVAALREATSALLTAAA